MECLKSFNIHISQAPTITNSNGIVRTWGTAGQYFYSLYYRPTSGTSIYNLQGFKRIDIYGIKVCGYVMGYYGDATKCAVVSDWAFSFELDGTSNLTSGEIGATNGFQLKTTSPFLNGISLSKYTNEIMFSSPYTNVKSINFKDIFAQGTGAEFLNEVALLYDLGFTFYYKYEGE